MNFNMSSKKLILLSVGAGLFFSNSNVVSLFANNLEETNFYSTTNDFNKYSFELDIYPELISLKINHCLELLDKYEKTYDKSFLYDCIFIFSSIPEDLIESYNFEFKNGDVFDFIFFNIRDHIYDNENIGNEQSDLIINLAENIFNGWKKNKLITVYKDKYLIKELIDYNKDKVYNVNSKLEFIKHLVNHPEDDNFGGSIIYPEDNIPGYTPPIIPPPVIKDEVENNNNNNGNNSNNNSNSSSNNLSNQSNGYFTEYIKRGNSCIKVRKLYKNGDIVSSKESNASKKEYVKCGIYDYVHTNSSNKDYPTVDRDYILSDQNLESKYTIHYTVNKASNRPYYFNSGIRTSPLNNSVTYNQLKDALYQLTIKSEGFSVVDNNKFLSIIDGKPVVLNKSKEDYSKLEVERLLNSFINVGFKILTPTDNDSGSLQSYLTNKKIDSFLFNGEVVKLSSPFILTENQLHGPIEEIAKHLGAKTTLSNNELIISKESTTIKLKVASKTYSINNEATSFISSPTLYNSSIYSEIDKIVAELGYELIWDEEFGELSIYNKE